MLPRVGLNDARRRRDAAIFLRFGTGGLQPQRAPAGQIQVPAVLGFIPSQRHNAGAAEYPRMNPGRDREVTIADIHGLLPGDRHRIAILLKRYRLPKRGLDKVGLAFQPAPVQLSV